MTSNHNTIEYYYHKYNDNECITIKIIISHILAKNNWGLAIFMVVMSVATAYVVPSSSAAKDVLLEQAQKEQQTNPYNMPTGTAAPQTDATAPAESAPATEAPATETPAPAAE